MTSPALPRPFWLRRLRDPVLVLFTQGISPDKVALTFAVGTACSLFPFLGFTSLLNLAVGLPLRMNQPLLQTLNQLLAPLHLIMILVYVRCGEWLWKADDDRFTIEEMIRVFREASIGDFLHRFGWAGAHAATAWALSVPLIVAGLYYSLRPGFQRLASSPVSQP